MRKIFFTLFCLIVILLCLMAFILIPKWFPQEETEDTFSQSSLVSSEESIDSLSELVGKCDTVFYGNIIKATVKEDSCEYTIQVSMVLFGRNLTSIGYVKVEGEKTLRMNRSYLFLAKTEGSNKYHYVEPYSKAPWIFEVNDNELKQVSKGDLNQFKDISKINLAYVKKICDNAVSSK